jgi:dihydroorotate dehydrogenase
VYFWVRWLLFLFSAENAHRIAFAALMFASRVPFLGALLRKRLRPADPRLQVRAFGKVLSSPVGLAAGFDKNAEGYNALSDLGFGFIEVGTVTAEPQPGNPKPRLFRLPRDRAIINRMGFNNHGAKEVSERLIGQRRTVVGVNIGKTKRVSEEDAIADYQKSARTLAPHADYLVVNVSSPNTPGLRALQAVDKLRPLLVAIKMTLSQTCADTPLLLKIAPDLSDPEIDAIADLALELELDGMIATNTTIERAGLRTDAATVTALGAGGLSGAPLKDKALQVLRRLRARVGSKLILIAAGGIETAEDVWERLEAGATLVQIYTSLIYGGPTLIADIHRHLLSKVDERKLTSIEAVSAAGS